MRRVATSVCLTSLIGVIAAASNVSVQQPTGTRAAKDKPGVISACALLPKDEVKRIAAPEDRFFDMIKPREESLGGGGSACFYSGIVIQINPFTWFAGCSCPCASASSSRQRER